MPKTSTTSKTNTKKQAGVKRKPVGKDTPNKRGKKDSAVEENDDSIAWKMKVSPLLLRMNIYGTSWRKMVVNSCTPSNAGPATVKVWPTVS